MFAATLIPKTKSRATANGTAHARLPVAMAPVTDHQPTTTMDVVAHLLHVAIAPVVMSTVTALHRPVVTTTTPVSVIVLLLVVVHVRQCLLMTAIFPFVVATAVTIRMQHRHHLRGVDTMTLTPMDMTGPPDQGAHLPLVDMDTMTVPAIELPSPSPGLVADMSISQGNGW